MTNQDVLERQAQLLAEHRRKGDSFVCEQRRLIELLRRHGGLLRKLVSGKIGSGSDYLPVELDPRGDKS